MLEENVHKNHLNQSYISACYCIYMPSLPCTIHLIYLAGWSNIDASLPHTRSNIQFLPLVDDGSRRVRGGT
ncbi:hypothetical protein EYC84_001615 [Monilinia fructicola]|uniref:Uncharacterized protein n=1 Tax=Monilinia fructicola TaxID=38448 RepID=A0A5M9JQ29_MONFR|nr:hypothetical protein EYC84_001615 [Monilinia fructicola]